MLRIASLVVFSIACLACTKKTDPPAPTSGSATASATVGGSAAGSDTGPAAGSGTADSGSAAGSGSAMAGSGSAMAGSGSAMAGSADGSGSAASVDFDKLSREEKVKFMKTKVMPVMKPAFQKFDAKEFGNFTCKTCHGKDPQKVKYEMPNPELPKLDFEAIKAGKEDPKMVEFMSKVVKPEMARILHQPEMSDTNPNGFGCLHCHEMKKKK